MSGASHVRVGGLDYAYIERGAGPLLLFGHGTFGGKELFHPQLERLSSAFHCVAIDWPGHGESSYDPAGWGVDDLVGAVPGLIDAFGHDAAVLVGVSQGGAVFMRCGLAHPERVMGLVNICAGPGAPPPAALDRVQRLGQTLSEEPDESARRGAVQSFAAAVLHAPGFADFDPQAAALERAVMLGHPREGIALAARVPASYVSIEHELSRIACPTLVIWGMHDLRPQLGAELAAAIPHARLVEIERAGHHANLDAPSETSAAIEDFLRERLGLGIAR